MQSRVGAAVTLIVGMAVLAGCTSAPSAPPETGVPTSGPTAVVSQTPTEAPPETAPPTSVPVPPAPAGPWKPVADHDSIGASQWLHVVWTGRRFVATGTALSGGGTFGTSRDGRSWKTAPSGGTTGGPIQIAASSGEVVAIGTLDNKTASWHSTDGIHWTWHLKVFPKALGADDVVTVNDVIPMPGGWLAVGADSEPCFVSCAPSPIRGLVWTSTNGLDWTRLANQASLKGGGLNAVAALDGGYVAAGDAGGRAAFWSSVDGKAWTRVADDPSFGTTGAGAGVQVVGLASRDGTIVAVGMEQTGGDSAPLVRAWRSTDGQAWSEASVEGALGGQVFSVAATASGFLATGPSGDTSCLGGIWASTDGSSWQCAASDPAFAGFGPYAAAGSPDVEVAVGLTDSGCEAEGACGDGLPGDIWWRPIP